MRIDRFDFRAAAFWCLVGFVVSFPISKAPPQIFHVAGLIFWLAAKIKDREDWGFLRDKLLLFVGGLFLFTLASAIFTELPKQSIRGMAKHLREITLFLMTLDLVRSEIQLKKLVVAGLFTSLVIYVDAVFQYGLGRDLIRGQEYYLVGTHPRLLGPFTDHTMFASFICVWGLIALALYRSKISFAYKERVLLTFYLFLSVFSLFNTQSRGGWLAFVLAVVLYSILNRDKLILAGLVTACLAGIIFMPRSMIIHQDAEKKEQSLVERGVLWQRAVDVIKAKPLLGTGINTYSKSHQKYDTQKNWRVQNYYAHNSYLQLAADRGLPALFCLLGFFSGFMVRGVRAVGVCRDPALKAAAAGTMTAVSAIMIYAIYDTMFEPLQIGMLFWFTLATGLAAFRLAAKRKEVVA